MTTLAERFKDLVDRGYDPGPLMDRHKVAIIGGTALDGQDYNMILLDDKSSVLIRITADESDGETIVLNDAGFYCREMAERRRHLRLCREVGSGQETQH
jgi:hypothetical protein